MGSSGDVPIPTDFDGDTMTDFVVWRPSDGTWYIRYSSQSYSYNGWSMYQWGAPSDYPTRRTLMRAVRHFSDSTKALTRPRLRRTYASQFHSEARLSKLRPAANLRPAIEKRRALFQEGHADHLSNCLKYEMRTHLVDLLVRQDRMTMGHGVETRVPFLDRQVIEFARALPAEHLVGSSLPLGVAGTKIVVKELARRSFDEAFVYRRKSAFNLPLAQYFRSGPFVALMEDRLLPGMSARGLVDVSVVRRWWRRALSAPATTEGFWILVALELWAEQFIDGRGLSR